MTLHSRVRKDIMDKLVRRVTVVQGSGENRQANVVYRSDDEDEDNPTLRRLEKTIRHMLKAQVIASQEAYQRHVEAVEKGGNSWVYEEPKNFMKARRKAMKEMRKAAPFKMMKFGPDDDDDEDDE